MPSADDRNRARALRHITGKARWEQDQKLSTESRSHDSRRALGAFIARFLRFGRLSWHRVRPLGDISAVPAAQVTRQSGCGVSARLITA